MLCSNGLKMVVNRNITLELTRANPVDDGVNGFKHINHGRIITGRTYSGQSALYDSFEE